MWSSVFFSHARRNITTEHEEEEETRLVTERGGNVTSLRLHTQVIAYDEWFLGSGGIIDQKLLLIQVDSTIR